MISGKRIILIIAIFAATWLFLRNTTTVQPVPIKKPLSLFPQQLGPWHRISARQLSAEVIDILKMDDYINYIYAAPDGKTIDLYVAFYQAVGISGGYHSPKNCLPGSGWGIEQVQSFTLPTGIEGRNTSTVSEMVIRKQKTSQIVLYWYQNRGRIIGSEYLEKVFLVVDGLFRGRRDGAFVRLISHVDDKDIPATEAVLKKFSVLAMKELENFLPGKKKNQ